MTEQGVYQVFCKVTEDKYIGSSKDMGGRLDGHKSKLINRKHPNSDLQEAWDLHGEDNFSFDKIDFCIDCNLKELCEKEQSWIDKYPFETLYNKSKYAYSTRGYKHTKEAIEKIRLAGLKQAESEDFVFNRPELRIAASERFKEYRKTQEVWNKIGLKVCCEICNIEFDTKPSRIEDGRGKYCSKECSKIGKSGKSCSPNTQFKSTVQFNLVPPNRNIVFTGIGLSDFSRLFNLDLGNLSNLLKGKAKSVKGWTLPQPNVEYQTINFIPQSI